MQKERSTCVKGKNVSALAECTNVSKACNFSGVFHFDDFVAGFHANAGATACIGLYVRHVLTKTHAHVCN